MKYLATFLFILTSSFLFTQSTFSHRFHFGFPAAAFTGLVATDTGYYVTGVVADSIYPFNAGNIFARFSTEGTPLMMKCLLEDEKTYETWTGSLTKVTDEQYVELGYTVDSLYRGLVVTYNPQTGDTLKTFTYLHAAYPEVTFTLPKHINVMEDGYLIANKVGNTDGTSDKDMEILKMDFEGNILWRHIHGLTTWTETPYRLQVQEDGYIVSGIRDNTNYYPDGSDIARNHLFKSNWSGEIEWEYFSPEGELRGKEGHAIATSDGGLLVYTGQGILFGTIGQWRFHNYVFKLDSNQQEEWGVLVKDSLEAISYINQLTSAMEISDGSGYLVAGNLAEYHPERSWHVGVLAKISPTGQLLWQRHYQHLEGAWYRHYLYDVDQSPDGGFIMVGEVRDTAEDVVRQQGWLLRVDEYGCLVPDCHLDDEVPTASAEVENAPRLLLYPNPASEELRIYFGSSPADARYRIVDITGRVLQQWEAPPLRTTLVLEVGAWTKGMYFLQCMKAGQVVKTEKFVVQ
jgi:hypothetical protein